jgi:FAD dependent oxidoreductase TIGR03364
MREPPYDVVVIGAGVLGTFHAFFACERGLRTLLVERADRPREASARNFGMIIPGAMPPGDWHRRGLESAAIYRRLAEPLGLTLNRGGTQYLATTPTEVLVLQEFARLGPPQGYRCRYLDARQSAELNPAIEPDHCLASLHFPDDLRLEPRALFAVLIPWMVENLGCTFLPRTVAVQVAVEDGLCRIVTADGQTRHARHVFVCTGSDVRTLFPERLAAAGLIHCKLQMLRTEPLRGVRLPTCLASGLSLRRYASFRLCPSWSALAEKLIEPELSRHGIHVLLAQDADGSVIVGDSHEYTRGDVDDSLDAGIEELILAEARRLARLPDWGVAARWHGVYTLHPERECWEETIDGRIHLVTGIGGKGMTTGPALAREAVARISAGT